MSPLFTSSQALAGSMGSWVTSFVLFSSCCTYALQKTGFLKRCAVWFVTRPITKKNPWMFLVMFFLGETVVGAFMSPLPTFIVFAAIAEQIFEELGYRKGDRFPNMVIFGTLAVASVSSVVTPIAHTVVTMSFSLYEQATGVAINWGVYTIYSIVIAIGIIAAIFLIMRFIYRPDLSRIKNMDTEFLKQGISKMGRQEIVSVVIFACVVVLWFLPGVVKTLDPENSLALYWSALGASVPPILGAVALCLIPVEEGKTIVTMAEAVKAAPWTAVMMVAGTMILGSALTNSEIGITTWLVGLIEPPGEKPFSDDVCSHCYPVCGCYDQLCIQHGNRHGGVQLHYAAGILRRGRRRERGGSGLPHRLRRLFSLGNTGIHRTCSGGDRYRLDEK